MLYIDVVYTSTLRMYTDGFCVMVSSKRLSQSPVHNFDYCEISGRAHEIETKRDRVDNLLV